jgi:hypothetical protein
MIRLLIAIVVGAIVAAGAAVATVNALSGVTSAASQSVYQYGNR